MHRTSASARYNGEVLAAAAGVEALYSITNMQAPLIKYHLTLNVAESYICTSSCTPAVARAAMALHSKYPFAGSATKKIHGRCSLRCLPSFLPSFPSLGIGLGLARVRLRPLSSSSMLQAPAMGIGFISGATLAAAAASGNVTMFFYLPHSIGVLFCNLAAAAIRPLYSPRNHVQADTQQHRTVCS